MSTPQTAALAPGLLRKTLMAKLAKPTSNDDLMIMPFDHRGTFEQKLFGIKDRPASEAEKNEISALKRIIYEGFLKAVSEGVPKNQTGILVDEQFGSDILHEAKQAGFRIACPAEKSGQTEFEFEYGDDFRAHVDRFCPAFVKVLVRYNPESDSEMNERQLRRLKTLSDYCLDEGPELMLELLVVATPRQLSEVGGDCARYDREMRPQLMIRAIKQIQDAKIEPALWKLEGIETEEQGQEIVAQARCGGRNQVGLIILGRGESSERVCHWLKTAAHVPGFIGFAVGRTIFWDALRAYREKRIRRDLAVSQIAQKYKAYCELWMREKAKRIHPPRFRPPSKPHQEPSI